MITLSASKLNKAYGTDVILEDISFNLNKGDRVGIIGQNGAGKTTLLNILSGTEEPDSGEIFMTKNTRVGYLRQSDNFFSGGTVYGEIKKAYDFAKSKNVEIYESEIVGMLNSMAFPESYYDKSIDTLSGGEKTRLAFAALLLKKPDLLFLDEPTNHLDIGTLNWLESYLKSFKGTMLLISHDRYFLDQTVNRIFEINNHKLLAMDGGYTEFADKKRLLMESEMKKYEFQQKEIKRQEEIIRRFKQHNTEKLVKRAQSREKRLAHVERIEKPSDTKKEIKIGFKQKYKSGNDVIFAEDLSKSFYTEEHILELFKNVDMDVKRGERICMVGANGIGKTTLFKILEGKLDPNTGYVKKGHNVLIGYYDQEQEELNESNTVIEEMTSEYRLYGETEMRKILGRFLFTGDVVFREIKTLSGGEKARLSLLKLMLSGANTLLLDEPTNHLDIWSKEIFEDALLEFPGTMMVISHDRYFLNKVPTRIVELEKERLVNYPGKYDYYIEKKETVSGKKHLKKLGEAISSQDDGKQAKSEKVINAAEERLRKKREETEKRRLEKAIKETEDNIGRIEEMIGNIEEDLTKEEIFSNHELMKNKSEELEALKTELNAEYKRWEECHHKQEELEKEI